MTRHVVSSNAAATAPPENTESASRRRPTCEWRVVSRGNQHGPSGRNHPRRAIAGDGHRAARREQQLMRGVRVRMQDIPTAVGGAQRTRNQERLLLRREPAALHARDLTFWRHRLSI